MIRVLCIDGEGGWGGSSRSLAKSLQYLDRDAVRAEVWCRREGPIQEVYARLGIPCRIVPQIPASGAVERFSRNLASEALAQIGWLRSKTIKTNLLSRIREVDLVHFNLESQWRLACWLRPQHDRAQTMHVRTNPIDNMFARRQSRAAVAAVNRFVFITENERMHFERMVGQAVSGEVIFNIVDRENVNIAPHPAIPMDNRLRVGVLSNFAWQRGVDRLVDVAEAIAERGQRDDIVFIIAGHMHLRGHLEGRLKALGRCGSTFADYVNERGLGDMFVFLGHVSQPEAVYVSCDVLAKPTRLDNPWGRDIIEALAFGRPVISIGTYDCFVENNVTGFLLQSFDPEIWAERLLSLHHDRELCRRLGAAGSERVATLCNGPARAADLLSLWQEAVSARRL